MSGALSYPLFPIDDTDYRKTFYRTAVMNIHTMTNTITRRGFLSLCAGLASITVLPELAEPILERRAPLTSQRIDRYILTFTNENNNETPPGCIALLRMMSPIVFDPQRLILSERGFGLLHLSLTQVPILENEIASDLLLTYQNAISMPFSLVSPAEEIIIAAINRNDRPCRLMASLIGHRLVVGTIEDEL